MNIDGTVSTRLSAHIQPLVPISMTSNEYDLKVSMIEFPSKNECNECLIAPWSFTKY